MDEFVNHTAFAVAFELFRPYDLIMQLMDDVTLQLTFAVVLNEIRMRLIARFAALLLDSHLCWLMAEQA